MFIKQRVWYLQRIRTPIAERGTPESQEHEKTKKAISERLGKADDKTVLWLTEKWETSVSAIDDDLNQVRSRAGQLLGFSGLLTVLAGVSTSLPSGGSSRVVAWVLVAIFAYIFLGTLRLTICALSVRFWNQPETDSVDKSLLEHHRFVHVCTFFR